MNYKETFIPVSNTIFIFNILVWGKLISVNSKMPVNCWKPVVFHATTYARKCSELDQSCYYVPAVELTAASSKLLPIFCWAYAPIYINLVNSLPVFIVLCAYKYRLKAYRYSSIIWNFYLKWFINKLRDSLWSLKLIF